MESEQHIPLTDEDLGISLVDVTLKEPPKMSRTMNALIFTVYYQGKTWRFGVIGREPLESVKKHGYKDRQGQVHLKIPQTTLKQPIGWIAEPY
jgi:hypothetical protein